MAIQEAGGSRLIRFQATDQTSGDLVEGNALAFYSKWIDVQGKGSFGFYWDVGGLVFSGKEGYAKLEIQHAPATSGVTPKSLNLFGDHVASSNFSTVFTVINSSTSIPGQFYRVTGISAGFIRFKRKIWGSSPAVSHNFNMNAI